MKPDNMVTIVLLAGGRATRLPDKLSLPIGDEAMLVKVYKQLTNLRLRCIISTREPLPADLGRHLSSPTVIDKYQDGGPLGGLTSTAEHVKTPLLFAAAGDLPNLDCGVVETLLRRYLDAVTIHSRVGAGDNDAGDVEVRPQAVVPRHSNGDLEPLAALYDTAALLRSAQRVLQSGRKKVTEALDGLRVTYYDIPASEEIKYVNVNTAEDLAKIQTR